MKNLYSFDFNPIGDESDETIYDTLTPTIEAYQSNKFSLDLFYIENCKF
jgi:hypothetical protein